MRPGSDLFRLGLVVCAALLILAAPVQLVAQGPDQADEEDSSADEGEATEEVSEEIFVTGSRIPTSPLAQRAPVVEVTALDINKSGLTSLGASLQQLPSMGTAINTRFNVPGNSGFPQDGTGIGAGAIQLSLRNLGAKRTLVLVDGKRWIAGASASGVPSAVDLNTLPANVIDRVEVLQDGASAIYGSDAIGGVVNIITKESFKGMKLTAQTGQFLDEGDGQGTEVTGLFGGGDRTRFLLSAAFYEEGSVETFDRDRSKFPTPDATSCLAGGCSSFTPQGRFILGPNFDFLDITLNDGVLNDGGANVPRFDRNDPNGGADFHSFSTADRFNFNGPGFNFLSTPNQRLNLYGSVAHDLSDNTRFVMRASYTNRDSRTMAAPEPLCLGAGCGNRIAENILIHRDQPFNPFGVDLSVANGNLEFFGRRPLESGGRIFDQDVNTYFGTVGFEGEIRNDSRSYTWDVSGSYGDNRGFQEKNGAHNGARLAVALGDPAVCAATPNCVPFNFFGGQGPGGGGSITQQMLDYVGFVQRDFSEQTLLNLNGNFAGDLVSMPNGMAGFAAGFEYREHSGSFRPDPVAASGETAGIPSGPTAGGFDVTEAYVEANFPLLYDVKGANYWEINVAGRYSDYSTFGGQDTYKLSTLWQPTTTFSVRGSVSTGIRGPGIGELFGGAAREDFTFLDPCADVLGVIGTANGGRDAPQPQNIINNCATLGVPVAFAQRNPQLSAVSAGNSALIPETSDNYSFGAVYSPGNWSTSLDFYDVTIDDAVQGRDPGDVIDACVETLDPFFCDAVERAGSGLINLVDNQLQNIGSVEASGFDLAFRWAGKPTNKGQFSAVFNATYLDEYVEFTQNPDGSLSATDRTGTLTDETFQRGFPEWRWLGTVDWTRKAWSSSLRLRWVDSMIQASGNEIDSVLYTDVQVRYDIPKGGSSYGIVVGINNLLDEDPPVCDACGVIGMSSVLHELPGTTGFVRFVWNMDSLQ